MNSNDIISRCGFDKLTSSHLSDLVHIKELGSRELSSDYLLRVLKYKDIITKYPFLEGEPLYISKNVFCPCYYYDKEALFPVHLSSNIEMNEGEITVEPILTIRNNEDNSISDSEEKLYKSNVARMKKTFKEGASGFYTIFDSSMAVEYFKEIIDSYDSKILFDTAIDLYTLYDYGFSSLSTDDFDKIVASRTKEHLSVLKEELSDLPDEITVYRGEGDLSSPNGYSYTLDINVATYFAIRYSDSNEPRLIKAKVKKEDIIWYTNDRFEEEIIAYPNKIYDKEEIILFTEEDLDIDVENIENVFYRFKRVLNKFSLKMDTVDHNHSHLIRVLYLGLFLMIRECPKNISLTDKDITTLAIALSLHDIGRDNDWEDTRHGACSYQVASKKLKKIIKENNYNDEWVSFLMEYHCKDDKDALKVLDNMNLSSEDKSKLTFLFNVIKDADALDRLRFGVKGQLDVTYLRLPNSIKYSFFANQLVRNFEILNV